MRRKQWLVAGVALTLLAHGAARAQTRYQIQPIARIGETAGDVPLPAGLFFIVAGLNDRGQLVFDAGTTDGRQPDRLVQYASTKFTPVMLAGLAGPVGPWPEDVFLFGPGPQSLNRQGDVVFAAHSRKGSPLGVFRWDARTGQAVPLAREGMPAGPQLIFRDLVDVFPAINNRDEVALGAPVTNSSGPSGTALLVIDAQGQVQPLLVPGQSLPDGTTLQISEPDPSINDAGAVAFLARRTGEKQDSAYLWDRGTITPLLTIGTEIPGVGKVSSTSRVLLDNQDQNALVVAGVGGSTRQGLYRIVNGQVTPVAVPGQPLPEDGKLANLQNVFVESTQIRSYAVSSASAAGQHVVVATLDGGATAAYLLGADGKLSLIIKSGMMSDLGQITRVEASPGAVNSQGQVALVVRVNGGPETLVVLNPIAS